MPAATTHNEFARDLYKALPDEIKQNITDLSMFNFGNQGPDFFFHDYMGMTPGSYMKYGELLHHEKVCESIMALYKYCRYDYDLYSYFIGYLGHYSLDILIHPLVNYIADAVVDNGDSHTVKHYKCESVIDVHMLTRRGLDLNGYCVDKDIRISRRNTEKLAQVYRKVFKEVYNIDLDEGHIASTARKMPVFLNLLKPNSRLKFRVAGLLENIIMKDHYITALGLYSTLDIDVLNSNKGSFYNTSNPEIVSDLTFDELYNLAISECLKRIRDVENSELYELDFEGKQLH